MDTGWWLSPAPLKNMSEVSWDDDILNIWKHKKMFQTTNQVKSVKSPVFLDPAAPDVWVHFQATWFDVVIFGGFRSDRQVFRSFS